MFPCTDTFAGHAENAGRFKHCGLTSNFKTHFIDLNSTYQKITDQQTHRIWTLLTCSSFNFLSHNHFFSSSHESVFALDTLLVSILFSALEPILVHNSSLDYLRGTVGYSYFCRDEQTLNVVQNWSINTFQLQVQPFAVKGDQFGAGKHFCLVECDQNISSPPCPFSRVLFCLSAEECQLDEDDMLIPIVVGAALAGLVVIVLLAYLIGRKRSHAGYQSIWGHSLLTCRQRPERGPTLPEN